jgi:hypothetical protein
MRAIEVDLATAKVLEAKAAELGTTVSKLVAELVDAERELPKRLETMRRAGRGPWAPDVLAEDVRRLEAFDRTGLGVPWEEVRAWINSWGTAKELPKPKPRKL